MLLLAMAVSSGGCVPDGPPHPVASGSPESCAASLREEVEAMEPRGIALRAPPGFTGESVFRIPVAEVGDWVIWTSTPGEAVPLVSVVRDGDLAVSDLAAVRCRRDVGAWGRPRDAGPDRLKPSIVTTPSAAALTDADLRSSLQTHPSGVVVYVWSPHMPLSVDGYHEMVEAAGQLGLVVEAALFEGADPAFARSEAARAGIPRVALREVQAAELLFRAAQVHAPSVVVLLAADRISPVLPGYRNAEGYRRWLERIITGQSASGPDRRPPSSGRRSVAGRSGRQPSMAEQTSRRTSHSRSGISDPG